MYKVKDRDVVIKCSQDVEGTRREYETMLRLGGLSTIVAPLGFEELSGWAALSMEHGGSTLLDGVQSMRDLSEIRSVVLQVQTAVAQLHAVGVAHLDVKLENFVINHIGRVRIIDFGFALYVPSHLRDTFKDVFHRGTVAYCAPEVLSKALADPFQADLWSLGVTIFAVATGRLPFCEASIRDVRFELFNRKRSKLAPMDCIRAVYQQTYDQIGSGTQLEVAINNLLLAEPGRRKNVLLEQIA